MAILHLRNRIRQMTIDEPVLRDYFDYLAGRLRIPANHSVEVDFCSERRIKLLKETHFGRRETTDCIAFPTEFPELGPEVPQVYGQVFICPEFVAGQALEHGSSFGDECLFVFTHGLLHLTGQVDDSPQQRKAMHERQRRLMAKGGFVGNSPYPFRWATSP